MKRTIALFNVFALLKQKTIIENILYYAIVLCLSCYSFLLFTFAAYNPWNYILMGLGIILAILIIIYNLFFSKIIFDRFSILLVCFMIATTLSYLLNFKTAVFFKTIYLVYGLSIFIYNFAVVSPKHRNSLIAAFFIGLFGFAIYYVCFYNAQLLNFKNFVRLGFDFDNQNSVARAFVILGLGTTYLAYFKKAWPLYLATILSFFLCLTTGSISNSLLFIAFVIFIFLYKSSKKTKIIASIISGVSIIAFIILLQFDFASYFRTRIENIVFTFFGGNSGRVDESSFFRFEFAVDALRFFSVNPLFGFGHGIVESISSGAGSFSHNNFCDLLSNYGIIGFIVFECLYVLPFIKKKSREENCLYPIFLCTFVFQLFLVTYYFKVEGILIPLAFAFETPNQNNLSLYIASKKMKFDLKIDKEAFAGKKEYPADSHGQNEEYTEIAI